MQYFAGPIDSPEIRLASFIIILFLSVILPGVVLFLLSRPLYTWYKKRKLNGESTWQFKVLLGIVTVVIAVYVALPALVGLIAPIPRNKVLGSRYYDVHDFQADGLKKTEEVFELQSAPPSRHYITRFAGTYNSKEVELNIMQYAIGWGTLFKECEKDNSKDVCVGGEYNKVAFVRGGNHAYVQLGRSMNEMWITDTTGSATEFPVELLHELLDSRKAYTHPVLETLMRWRNYWLFQYKFKT